MDESQQIRAAQNGSLGAFNDLVGAYEARVYNLCYRMLGNPDAAADATQDTFLSAYQAIGRFRGGSLKAWLLRIATNACYDQLRRNVRRPTQSLDEMMDDPDAPVDFPSNDRSGDPEARAEQAELRRDIGLALLELPDEQRMALVLSDIQGLSYEEIAEVTSSSLGTVKSRISRARFKMRDALLAKGTIEAKSASSKRNA